jgi:hypothetical protein
MVIMSPPPPPAGSVVGSQPSNNGLKVQGFMNFNSSSSYSPKISDVLPVVLALKNYLFITVLFHKFTVLLYVQVGIVHPMDSFRPRPVACNLKGS